jgi:hypothetical protein
METWQRVFDESWNRAKAMAKSDREATALGEILRGY